MADAIAGPLSALEMAVVEQNAVARGISIDVLMENAGRAVAEEAARRSTPSKGRILVLAGTGNNGGDGTCAAHYLHQWGYGVDLFLVRPPSEIRSAAALRCWERARRDVRSHVGLPDANVLDGVGLAIDAMLGSGQTGPLRSPYREAVELLRASNLPVLSVDLPTGLGGPTAVRPLWTVALTTLKEGMDPPTCGEITVRDIGIPPEAARETGPGEFLLYPAGPSTDRPGRQGRVIVVGGGPYSGAPALAALAALRSGAERATVFAPEPAASAIRGYSPDLVVHALGNERFRAGDAARFLEVVARLRVDAVVLGMGMGRAPESLEFARTLLEKLPAELPVVVDAEALAALTPASLGPPRRPLIATPNAAELEHIFHLDPPPAPDTLLESIGVLARKFGVTFVAKGKWDALSDGNRGALNRHHPASQNVAGAGDVLGGLLGGLLAQDVAPMHAARLATYWAGSAGYHAAENRGFGLIASDIVEALPAALVSGLQRVRRDGVG
ncbi:MAG: NAD(P)H-hydrate dehydratase [Thermoplasmata archaeon]|nr:NAD(P)H-hydrate dehydratase [Thermoplasmata archaeon]